MNPRERLLAVALGALVLVGGGGFALYQFFWHPSQARTKGVRDLQSEIDRKTEHVSQVKQKLPKLEMWARAALPESPAYDPQRTKRDYERFLSNLIRRSGIPEPTAKVEAKQFDAKSNPQL